jgi:hypothetical protein
MSQCKLIKICPFFNDRMLNMPSLMDSFKQTYCRGVSVNCARYLVSMAYGKDAVPVDLFPNQIERAEKIIQKKEKESAQ